MADFTLEAGIQVVSGDIDKLIRSVQGEVNRKKVTVPVRADQYSLKQFVESVQKELNKQTINIVANE